MSTIARGRAIFDELVEYPLPTKTGVKDYVIYFVPNDGYGKGARRFFSKFFPRHVAKQAQSLEDMVAFLSGEIKAKRVDQIREIVIVSHGNAQGLLFPVLTTIGPTTKVYKYLTAFSLTCLQKDFSTGLFPTFNANRKDVVAHLSDKSWITLRACNFGQSREGMFAFCSFFGGKANFYAPQVYQFFGWHPVMEGLTVDVEEKNGKVVTQLKQDRNRLDSKVAVHSHLVKQRFLPRDVHTPDRKDAIVDFYLDKARFSESFLILAVRTTDTTSPDAVQYDQIVKDLNDRKVNAFLKTKFGEHDMQFTKAATVKVKVPGSDWLIRDKLIHDNKTYTIEYHVEQKTDFLGAGNTERTGLWGEARIVDLLTSNQGIPIQRFFYESENRIWRAQLFTLASYSEDPAEDPQAKPKLEAFVAMLDKAKIKDGGSDLVAEFKNKGGIDLAATAKVTVQPPTGTPPRQQKSWIVADPKSYVVKLEHPFLSNGTPAHALTVYSNFDQSARLIYDCEILQYLGEDPDTPGPELAANLDRYSIDDLTKLIDFLRAPYKPENVVYIYHAQEAIKRKKESLAWWTQQYGEIAKTQPLFEQPYSELYRSEQEDRNSLVYDFDFPQYWREVKASDPPTNAVQQDLFTEELLWKRFHMQEADLAVRTDPDDVAPDSPFNNDDDVRVAESRGLERYVSVQKYVLDTPEPADVSCAEFRQLVTKWKELQGKDLDEIQRQLDLIKTVNGRTFLQTIFHYYDKLQISGVLMGLSLWNIASVKDGLLSTIVSKLPLLSESAWIGGIVSVLPAITIPFGMWMKFLKQQEATEQVWENVGKLTAIRQWLRMLIDLTYRKETSFPATFTLDVSSYISANPYFVGRYYQEQIDQDGAYSPFIFAPTRMKKGFDEAAALMDAAGQELLRKADDFIDETLRSSGVFDSCKIAVLKDLGIIDMPRMRALVLRQIAQKLLETLPHV